MTTQDLGANPGPVLYCGDSHGGPNGSLHYIVQAALDVDASAVILLGDIEPRRPLHQELHGIADRVWWISGNHDADSDDVWRNLYESDLADRCIDGRTTTLPDGTVLAGVGGVFRESVWHPDRDVRFRSRAEHARATPRQDRWNGGPPRRHTGTIYPRDFEVLSSLRADVLVSHEAPAYHPHGFSVLDALAQAMGVQVAVHGHHHDARDSSHRWREQRFSSFGVGFRGITAIDLSGQATTIRRGECEHERR